MRDKLKQEFLTINGFADYEVTLLPADASFRTYSRLKKNDFSYILMDCPPEKYSLEPFIKIDNYLLDSGFSAPQIYHQDHKNGFMILEDFGNISIRTLLNTNKSPEFEKQIYQDIIKLLCKIQKLDIPGLDNHSSELMIKDSNIFLDYFLPTFTLNGEAPSTQQREEYNNIWKEVFKYINFQDTCLTLRDYHVDNLMYLENREGINKIGLLDFQDAIIGYPAYDLVSLLEDARRDVDYNFANELINFYLSLNTNFHRKDFLAAYSILGAQRNLRILGVFAKKAIIDKNNKYLSYIPRVKKYLEYDLSHPLLSPLKKWLNTVAPDSRFT